MKNIVDIIVCYPSHYISSINPTNIIAVSSTSDILVFSPLNDASFVSIHSPPSLNLQFSKITTTLFSNVTKAFLHDLQEYGDISWSPFNWYFYYFLPSFLPSFPFLPLSSSFPFSLYFSLVPYPSLLSPSLILSPSFLHLSFLPPALRSLSLPPSLFLSSFPLSISPSPYLPFHPAPYLSLLPSLFPPSLIFLSLPLFPPPLISPSFSLYLLRSLSLLPSLFPSYPFIIISLLSFHIKDIKISIYYLYED